MKKILITTAVLFLAIFVIATGAALSLFGHEMWLQVFLLPKLEKELGFHLGTPYVDTGSRLESEVIAVHSLTSNGIFRGSGVVPEDIVVRDKTIGGLCKRLDRSRGREVTLYLASGGNGLPVQERPVKKITFRMPEKLEQSGNGR